LRYDPHSEKQITQEVLPALTSEFPTPAQRPLLTAMNCERFQNTFGLIVPDWKETLRLALETE
jgi:dTDP-4-dehydrorhamnose reductase